MGFWLALAALLHAETALVVGVGLYFFAPRDADLQRDLAAQGESIDIGMVDDSAAREILADLERAEEKAKAEQIEKEIDSVKAPGQVIDLPAPREEKRPDDAHFAGEHDSSVDRETKKYGKFDEKSRQGDASGNAEQSHKATPASPTDERLRMREPNLGRARPSSWRTSSAAARRTRSRTSTRARRRRSTRRSGGSRRSSTA